jgi:hypothetical protein
MQFYGKNQIGDCILISFICSSCSSMSEMVRVSAVRKSVGVDLDVTLPPFAQEVVPV